MYNDVKKESANSGVNDTPIRYPPRLLYNGWDVFVFLIISLCLTIV